MLVFHVLHVIYICECLVQKHTIYSIKTDTKYHGEGKKSYMLAGGALPNEGKNREGR